MRFERCFRLAAAPGVGVCCDERGLFVLDTPLLERTGCEGRTEWRPRPVDRLNRELGRVFGLPIEFRDKIGGLASVARSLGRGDVVRAQIAALLFEIPDPPKITKAAAAPDGLLGLARQLRASGLLAIDPPTRGESAQNVAPLSDERNVLDKYNHYHDERGRFTTADAAVDPKGRVPNGHVSVHVDASDVMATNADAGDTRANLQVSTRPEPTVEGTRVANVSCADLLESDIQICHSTIFEDDHHHRKLCVEGAFQRNRECLAGGRISPLLPY
jgi:hypothetical protein